MIMILKVENKKPIEVSEFSTIEKALRSLKSYGPRSYAILENSDGSYIQVAGGRVTCVLELREKKDNKHLRAYLPVPHVCYTGEQTLMFGAGKVKMQPDEILFIDDVVSAFRAFFENLPFPSTIKWRDMSNIFNDPST
ncbi:MULTISPECIES: hypothetical protein [Komagataeibacter]|uniref:hypothetical protein n=1 Tax=Komagataeibacter TaxID=1434011 RepID=UPI0009E56395|nr:MULTISPECIES: hypothetical protein [Komagataeibacter]